MKIDAALMHDPCNNGEKAAVAIASARNPMNIAYLANDLQYLAQGRFILGLGSQIRAHIERRFSMPWSRPCRSSTACTVLLAGGLIMGYSRISFSRILGAPQLGNSRFNRSIDRSTWNGSWLAYR